MSAVEAAAKKDAPLNEEKEEKGEVVDDPLGGFIIEDEADDGEAEEVCEVIDDEAGACENGNSKVIDLTDSVDLESSTEPDLNHPLKDLLENYEPPAAQLTEIEAGGPAFMGEFPVHEITAAADLVETVKTLQKETEIGVFCATVGKEYQKQLCYLVLSTKAADYLIDLASIKDVTPLAPVFANPDIVKVLFNTKLSLYYLQQHLKLYCINVFSIDVAMETLGEDCTELNLNGLLLSKYGITRLDDLDFTKRPLDILLRTNLQSASHFLVHLYRKLRNRLLNEKKCLADSLKSMNKACLVSYKSGKSVQREALIGEIKSLHQAQLAVLERLNLWRNRVAKVLDRNPNQVLDKQCLKVLSMLLPEEVDVIKSLSKSEYVKQEVGEIQRIIKDARVKYNAGFVAKATMAKFLQEPPPKRPSTFQEPAAKKAKVASSPVQSQPKTPTASPTPKPPAAAKPKFQSQGGRGGGAVGGGPTKNFQSAGGQAKNYQNQGGQKNLQSQGGGGGQIRSLHSFSMRPNPAVFGSAPSSGSMNTGFRKPAGFSPRGGGGGGGGGYSNSRPMDNRAMQSNPNASWSSNYKGRGTKRRQTGGFVAYDPFARN